MDNYSISQKLNIIRYKLWTESFCTKLPFYFISNGWTDLWTEKHGLQLARHLQSLDNQEYLIKNPLQMNLVD